MSRLNRIKKIRYKLSNTDSLELSKEDIEFLCEWAEKGIEDISKMEIDKKKIRKAIKFIKEDLEILENFSLFAGKHSKVNGWKIEIYETILMALEEYKLKEETINE